jgi:hypothetical protein
MFCAPRLVFHGTEGVPSRFHVFPFPDMFSAVTRASGPFLCFALPDSFLMVPRASGPVLTFCAPDLIFGGTGCVWSRFNVLCSQTRFQRYRWRRVPFSCFALPDSFSTVPRASGLVCTFCVPGHVFGGTGGIGSHFLVLRARTRFCRYRGRRVLFSCFARPDSFSTVPRASGSVFMFCAPGRILDGTERVRSPFHVLCASTLFLRY